MKKFADLFLALENTSKTTAKVALLSDYFRQASDKDKVWAIAIFSHKRPKSILNTRQLREVILEITQMPPWLLEESYQIVGDLAETLSLVLPENVGISESYSLDFWITEMIKQRKNTEEEKKDWIKRAIAKLERKEIFVLFKILTGGLRLGISQKLMQKALAQHTGVDASLLAHRLMGNWQPEATTFEKLVLSEEKGEQFSRPYPFYLAYAVEKPVHELGDISEWQAEWKWDGIRAQIIFRNKEMYLWSRGEELLTEKFPELLPLKDAIPNGTVIDGELLPFKNGNPLPFAVLQTRISRKNLTKKITDAAPPVIKAYDILEWNGQDIRQIPLKNRRQLLQKVVTDTASDLLLLSETITEKSWEQLSALQSDARSFFAEGIMLKDLSSPYGIGRKKGDWWKWKIDPMTIDAVMIYAQKGHGRRADIYSDYTFAVWDGEVLVPFAKAYSGLTDKELLDVSRFVRKNTKEKFGPVRTVTPELVFEIAFEGIQLSSRHKSGVAVRFPRIHRWRKDKKIKEANTLADLKALLKHYGA